MDAASVVRGVTVLAAFEGENLDPKLGIMKGKKTSADPAVTCSVSLRNGTIGRAVLRAQMAPHERGGAAIEGARLRPLPSLASALRQ
jgi:hypothetical protein